MLYDSYLFEQMRIVKNIVDLEERLMYLNNARNNFTSVFPNTSLEAQGVKDWFKNMIDQTQFEIMKNIALRGNASTPDIATENINNLEENSLIFKNELLSNFYVAFNGYLWEDVELSNFMDWFRKTPIGKPEIPEGMKTYLCYALGQIVDRRDLAQCSNFGTWVTQIIGNVNFSTLKKKAVVQEKIEKIDEKIRLIL